MKWQRTTILGEFLNYRQRNFALLDSMIYGTSFLRETKRKWWNPMYWILGEVKLKRLDPLKVAIDPKDWRAAYRGGGIS